MIRFFPGILLVQLVVVALWWINRDKDILDIIAIVLPTSLLLSTVIALWFSMISRMETQKANAELVEKHFEEREKLNKALEKTRSDVMRKASAEQVKILERASQEREQLVRETHKDIVKAERRASRSANMKVGAAFTVVTVAGVGLLFVQFLTLGLLTITAAGGALGGYIVRWKQTRNVNLLASGRADPRLSSPESADGDDSDKKPVIIDAKK